MNRSESTKVPAKMQPKFDEIVTIIERVCQEHLTAEYADLARQMAAALSRKRPSPLSAGQAKSWAAGIVYALGRVNFLFDKSQEPHMSASELSEAFGVSASTASAKSTQIWKLMDLMPFHPNWSLPSLLDQNPLVWMLSVNGMIVDIRSMPRVVQEQAYEQGLIPYIPADRADH